VTITVLAWSFFSLVCFVAWYSGYLTYRDTKFAGMFVNRNEFAINTVFLVSVALFFSRNRIVLFFSVFICALLIGISNSTTGCLVLVFALFYPYFLTARFWKKILAIFSGILLVFAAYNLLPEVQKRINSVGILLTEPQELDGSVFLRAHFILEGIRIALENPLCGIGVDNSKFFLFDPRYANSHGWYSHNNYVEMLLNVGFPGFLLYYGPLVFVFIRVKPKHKFYIEIRTFALIFFISGISSVQYNFIPSVFLYLLTLFLFKYYSDRPLEKVLQPG
jgi:O-antigen ligase